MSTDGGRICFWWIGVLFRLKVLQGFGRLVVGEGLYRTGYKDGYRCDITHR